MEEKKLTYEQAFQEAVPTIFGFLVSEFGFSLTHDESWLFEGQTEYALIEIVLDRHTVQVGMRPVDPKDQYLPEPLRRAGKIPLELIVRCLDPDLHIGFKTEIKPEGIRGDLEKYADLLRRYCSRMLSGDFGEWANIQAYLEKRK
ncbi:MAG: hypothetical protein HY868_27175 [Chloroflexi bacterium]|nr:hypothetical protein [Chloroflexota bacterium]